MTEKRKYIVEDESKPKRKTTTITKGFTVDLDKDSIIKIGSVDEFEIYEYIVNLAQKIVTEVQNANNEMQQRTEENLEAMKKHGIIPEDATLDDVFGPETK